MLGVKSFHAAAPFLWNSLPAELHNVQSWNQVFFKDKDSFFSGRLDYFYFLLIN